MRWPPGRSALAWRRRGAGPRRGCSSRGSSEPLVGSDSDAAADPLFDPIGGFDRVDTHAAPIIVTTAARAGAQSLAPSARLAANDLRRGGCTRAREAIIVGGTAAVPRGVEAELLSLGYEEVFRVAGVDRFDTAARIATALGTEPAPAAATCVDERTDDGGARMGFYGNAVIEYRPDAATCQVYGRTVVLAEGQVGADALAAGWWTSFWQVPVLLVAEDGSLPPATRAALQSIPIDTIVVLGGTGRIPEAVVEEATRLAGAVAGRFGGFDRYETSAITARTFGGWYATGDPADFAGDRICLAASSGTQEGWPDALAAGPFCARLAATGRRAPARVLEPVAEARGAHEPPAPAHDAVPVLLVPARATPTPAVAALLNGAFPADGDWCRAGAASTCRAPGFAVAFGGTAVVSDGALATVSTLLAGGDRDQGGAAPAVVEPFRTDLDLRPVYEGGVTTGEPSACVDRGAMSGVRWLALYGEPGLVTFRHALDAVEVLPYDANGTNRAICVPIDTDGGQPTLVGVSAAGRSTLRHVLDDGDALRLSASMRYPAPITSSGASGPSELPGARTVWRYRDEPGPPLVLHDGDRSQPVTDAAVDITLTRRASGEPARFEALVRVVAGGQIYEGTVIGDARLVGTRWELAGHARVGERRGGFRAWVDTQGTTENGDDPMTWRADAYGA